MSYHPLTNETGGGADERRAEADRIVKMLEQHLNLDEELTSKEQTFVSEMAEGNEVSPKQLFWLRDIKDKYL